MLVQQTDFEHDFDYTFEHDILTCNTIFWLDQYQYQSQFLAHVLFTSPFKPTDIFTAYRKPLHSAVFVPIFSWLLSAYDFSKIRRKSSIPKETYTPTPKIYAQKMQSQKFKLPKYIQNFHHASKD